MQETKGRGGKEQTVESVARVDEGSVSTGLIHATPGVMKSLRSSADRIALIPAMRFNGVRTLAYSFCSIVFATPSFQSAVDFSGIKSSDTTYSNNNVTSEG